MSTELRNKTFIENTYEQMKNANIVRSSEHFSTDFLGKSKSYYRAMKAQGMEASNAMLTKLANELNTRRTMFEQRCTQDLSFYYDKWRAVEDDVAKELALRATDRGAINNHALHSVLSVIQQLVAERRT